MNFDHDPYKLRKELPKNIDLAIVFLIENSLGFGHNRARAHIARKLKHFPVTEDQRIKIVSAVLEKLEKGRIDEQFTDQLRLAFNLSPEVVRDKAKELSLSPKDHVRKYANKVLRMRLMGETLYDPNKKK